MAAKYFNTAGPNRADLHYLIPPLERIDLDEVLTLIDQQKYFVLHAPRQTGKTSCLLALTKYLNETGRYRALYVNVESAQAMREDVHRALVTILSRLGKEAINQLSDPFPEEFFLSVANLEGDLLLTVLEAWAQNDAKPICLMIDEIDTLIGDSLISVLRQLRSGYASRSAAFPQTIVLCGVRDVRDYRMHSSKSKDIVTGGSPFNIKAESLSLGDFTLDEIRRLYQQHTTETGQRFEEAVFPLVWELTQGQPWLVNALAYATTHRMKENRDRSRTITAEMFQEAKEELILRRETHLDQLSDKLKEDRVRRVIQPMLAGEDASLQDHWDDVQYVIDLGLIRGTHEGSFEIANAIYREVIPRELNYGAQINLGATERTAWYVAPDGRLDMVKLLEAFQQFFRENSEIWLERFSYREAAPHLLLQAFLQRVVNGGGRIDREYGLGRKRTDLLVVWHYPQGTQRVVIELKILRKSLESTLAEGITQTKEYMDRTGTSDAHLIIFDPTPTHSWEQKIFRRVESGITVWGM